MSVKAKTGGTAVGIAYWFTLHMYGGITISTYQPEAVSRSDLYLWKFLITKLSIHMLVAEFKPLASECVSPP